MDEAMFVHLKALFNVACIAKSNKPFTHISGLLELTGQLGQTVLLQILKVVRSELDNAKYVVSY
jgi:hypothetical protein